MEEQPEVLVVGAGPSGVVAAMLLADAGVSSRVVDRRVNISPMPRARGIHARASEILRGLDVAHDVRAAQLVVDPCMQVRPSLNQAPLAEVPTGGETFDEVSPCEGIAISQDVFEAVLRDHLARRSLVTLALGQELRDLVITDQGGLTATVVDHASGQEQRWHPRYLLGADGVRSTVRRIRAGPARHLDGGVNGRARTVPRLRADVPIRCLGEAL